MKVLMILYHYRPSIHSSFGKHEKKEKEYFEEVERKGREDQNCSLVYPECEKSFLDHFTEVMDTEENI